MTEGQLQAGRPERPITTIEQDALGRSGFVRRLGDALVDGGGRATGVVVGLTGPWGSGKSSILNLLAEELSTTHPDTVVVRFDPWLVAGRNDLISEFISELLGTIRASYKKNKQIKKFTSAAARYGAHVAPAGNLFMPGAGTAAAGGLKAVESALGRSESLSELRSKLLKSLDDIPHPVVVLVDELDRVDDEEIKTVAQLVRSVMDFPGISYVLAYDADRVIQALGSTGVGHGGFERGRAYLEKIVQLQIPLPVSLPEERLAQLGAELNALSSTVYIPHAFFDNVRYQEVSYLLAHEVVHTPRDIKRLIGIYHVISGMVGREVDWLDLLQYCALLSKAPRTIERIKSEPDFYVQDPVSVAAHASRIGNQEHADALLSQRLVDGESDGGVKALLKSLFPRFQAHGSSPSYPDALCFRRPLMTTLRLGLLPGGISRSEVEKVASQDADYVEQQFALALKEDRLSEFLDRLEELYPTLEVDHLEFWSGVLKFCAKDTDDWLSEISIMRSISENMANLLVRSVRREKSLQPIAEAVIRHATESGDLALAPIWIRRQSMHHGLFRWTNRQGEGVDIFEPAEMQQLAITGAKYWKSRLLGGTLLNRIWDLHALYAIADAGLWDAKCKAAVRRAMKVDAEFDSLVLQMFGRNYLTEGEAIDMMVGLKWFNARLSSRRSRLDEAAAPPDVVAAIQKALDHF